MTDYNPIKSDYQRLLVISLCFVIYLIGDLITCYKTDNVLMAIIDVSLIVLAGSGTIKASKQIQLIDELILQENTEQQIRKIINND